MEDPTSSCAATQVPADWSLAIAPNVRLSAWVIDRDVLNWTANPSRSAFSVRIIVSGEVHCGIAGSWSEKLGAPSLCTLAGFDETLSVQLLGRSDTLRIVGIDFDLANPAEEDMICVRRVADRLRCPLSHRCPFLRFKFGTRPLRSLAAQIITCPLDGFVREVYLAGKGLELLALAMDCMSEDVEKNGAAIEIDDLSIGHIDRVKSMIRSNVHSPPSLDELSRSVGVCTRRLTDMFRLSTGMSIATYLQECRFEKAFSLLSDTRLQIAEIAYSIGYTPAHFSTAFKKRFGLPPKDLRASCE